MVEVGIRVTNEGVVYYRGSLETKPYTLEEMNRLGHNAEVAKKLETEEKEILKAHLRHSLELPQPEVWEDIVDASKYLLKSQHFITMNDTNDIYLYQNGAYKPNAEAFILKEIEDNVKENTEVTKHFCSEVIGHIQRSTYVDRKEFDTNPSFLVLDNCILDLDTYEVKQHSPEYYTKVKLPVKYDGTQDCPNIKKFLDEVFYPDDIFIVQEFLGSCLWRNYETQKALMLVGDGSNGKSTFIYLIKSLIGSENIASKTLQELEFNRFAKAELYGKLVNLFADLPEAALKSTTTFKSLTGGDPITAEYKGKTGFPFINYAKLVFSTNAVPEAINDDTFAFFRRWILLTLPNRFEGVNENKDLLKKLTTQEELSGLLNWTLEGLKRLRSNGWKFSYTKTTDQLKEEYIRKSSPMKAFIMDCLEIRSDGYVEKQVLFNAYAEYCRNKKLPSVTSDTFFKRLPQYARVETIRKEIGDKRPMCFIGIDLKDKTKWGTQEEDQTTLG